MNNLINLFQFEDVQPELLAKLNQNGFAIAQNNNIQLFHVYEQNDYQQVPNFVTTDMFMQLFHMYFGYVLRETEEGKLIPLARKLCLNLMNSSSEIGRTATNLEQKKIANRTATFYAIAYTALTRNTGSRCQKIFKTIIPKN